MPGMLHVDMILHHAPTVVSAAVDGAITIFHPERDRYYALDGVGAAIWSLLSEPRALGDVVRTVVERYDVTHEVCERDTLALAEQLLKEGLIGAALESPR